MPSLSRLFLIFFWLFACLSTALSVDARENSKSTQPKSTVPAKKAVGPGADIHVIQMDPDVSVDQLSGPGVDVHRVGDDRGGEIVPPVERDALFKKAGISGEVAGWDDMEKDMFLMRAKTKSLRELAGAYPRIPQKKLKALQAAARPSHAGRKK